MSKTDKTTPNQSADSETDTFDTIREELRHWPYTIHQIHDTLDLSLIEGRAKQLLFQSLNTRNITAFVGSGISAAYGRMGWSEWQRAQITTTQNLTTSLLDLAKASDARATFINTLLNDYLKNHGEINNLTVRPTIRWVEHRLQRVRYVTEELNKLQSSFNLAQAKKGNFPGGESLPIKFEIAQKLHDLVIRNRDLFLPKNQKSDSEKQQLVIDKENENEIKMTIFWGVRPDTESGAFKSALQDTQDNYFTNSTNLNKMLVDRSTTEKYNNTIKNMQFCMDKYLEVAKRPEGQMTFEDLTKTLLVDECAHAEELLLSGLSSHEHDGRVILFDKKKIKLLRNDLDVISLKNCKRDIDGIRQNPDRFRVMQYFRLDKVRNYLNDTSSAITTTNPRAHLWHNFFDSLKFKYDEYSKKTDNQRIFLTPTSRFIIKLFLKLSPDPEITLNKLFDDSPLSPNDYVSRRSTIANRLDPLDRTIRHLNIHRYLTTNYDFEIERFYQDIGFRKTETRQSDAHTNNIAEKRYYFDRGDYRVDGIGSALWDTCFDPARAADLITFASDTTGADASVFHLHGRATLDDPLVITERNYMEMYIKTDERREMINEGITMAFSATPILFIGLGMDEADVLRPLRQFISDNDQSRGYTAMVLIPADKGIEARSKFASALYLRYGTHTIFYGSGEIQFDKIGETPHRVAVDWLHRISSLIQKLNQCVTEEEEHCVKLASASSVSTSPKTTLEELNYKPIDQQKRLDKINQHVGIFGPDLAQASYDESTSALPILFGYRTVEELKSHITSQGVDNFPALKSPFFTTQRPGNMSQARMHRMQSDNTEIDGSTFLDFYLNLFDHLLNIFFTNPTGSTSLYSYQRDLAAQQAALGGLQGALLTASLCASLTSLSMEWRTWWKHWQQRPPHRTPILEKLKKGVHQPNQPPLPRRFIRFRVINSISDMDYAENTFSQPFDPETSLPAVKTNIRSFDTFVEALASQPSENIATEAVYKRRFYTIAADTGLGKGTFFSIFSTRLGLSSYLYAAHPCWSNKAKSEHRVVFMASIFLNFSYSTEIASTYDMSLNVLKDSVSTLFSIVWILSEIDHDIYHEKLNKLIDFPVRAGLKIHPLNSQTQDSLTALFSLDTTWDKTLPHLLTSDHTERQTNNKSEQLLFDIIEARSNHVLDNLHIQFRDTGRGEFLQSVTEIFGKLSKLLARAGLKYVSQMSGSNNNTSAKPIITRFLLCLNGCELFFESDNFTKNLEVADFLNYLASKEMSEVPADIITIGSEKRLGLPWSYSSTNKSQEKSTQYSGKHNRKYGSDMHNHVMVRKNCNSRAIRLIKKRAYLSSIVFEKKPFINKLGLADPNIHHKNMVHFTRIMDPTRLLVDNFLPLAAVFHGYRIHKNTGIEEKDPHLFRKSYRHYQKRIFDIWSINYIVDIADCVAKEKEIYLCNILSSLNLLDPDLPADINSLRDTIVDNYRKHHLVDLKQWNELRLTFSSNRFMMTLVLAAAQEIALSEDSWILGAEKAEAFMNNTANRVRNVSNQASEETVLQAVLDVYRLYHKIGDPVYDIELHHHLLRNIAVINSPIGSNVIARLPSIRQYLNSVTAADNVTLGRRRMVAKALFSLGERGLVFHITPHSDLVESNTSSVLQPNPTNSQERDRENKGWPQSHNIRYSLHRTVQQYCVSKLGSTAFEPVRINSFAPSLYASMPSGVPRLSHEAYRYLRAVMVGLSQYPDIPHTNTQDPVWLYSTQDRITKIQSLRASMSMVRSTFSVAVVSRFEEYKSIPGESEQRSRGYFETYKVRLRWIIRKAWELYIPEHDSDGNVIEIGSSLDPTHDGLLRTNALYRDEIVWLYNEVGITSLVQGNLRDAVAHLRQALELCEKIEGVGGGRQHNMISLNLAIAQIERGRLSKANERLKSLRRREKGLRSRVYYLATGYRGLIMHLMGRRKRAQKLLMQAARYFETKSEDRATAIFMNHLARLVPDRNITRSKEALRTAREHAEAGGHEDIRHHILISLVRISQFNEKKPHDTLAHDRLVVQDVQEYARVMGIPSLTCDALHTEAQILLANGDSHSSGKLLIRAMAIARRNDLQLRLSSMLTSYARVLLQRGSTEAARRLLISSLEIAKKFDYALQVDRTLRILEDEEFGVTSVH